MKKKKGDVVVTCQACKGAGWLPGNMVRGEKTHKILRPIKWERCRACGGAGKFVT